MSHRDDLTFGYAHGLGAIAPMAPGSGHQGGEPRIVSGLNPECSRRQPHFRAPPRPGFRQCPYIRARSGQHRGLTGTWQPRSRLRWPISISMRSRNFVAPRKFRGQTPRDGRVPEPARNSEKLPQSQAHSLGLRRMKTRPDSSASRSGPTGGCDRDRAVCFASSEYGSRSAVPAPVTVENC